MDEVVRVAAVGGEGVFSKKSQTIPKTVLLGPPSTGFCATCRKFEDVDLVDQSGRDQPFFLMPSPPPTEMARARGSDRPRDAAASRAQCTTPSPGWSPAWGCARPVHVGSNNKAFPPAGAPNVAVVHMAPMRGGSFSGFPLESHLAIGFEQYERMQLGPAPRTMIASDDPTSASVSTGDP